MNEQMALQNLLRSRFGDLKVKNPSYSLRAFARKVGINSGALSAFLNGKRRVSRKMALRISDNLGLDPQERAEVLAHFQATFLKKSSPSAKSEPLQYLQLSSDQFRLISKWYHFAILSLMRTQGFKSDSDWIAERLGITATQSKEALERLSRLGMISIDSDGKIRRSKSKYRTTDDIANVSLRQGHAENLELAKDSLLKHSVTERDFTAATMSIDPKKLPEAKEKIRKFQDELAEFLESGTQAEVYKICIQLFPLTALKKENSYETK